VEEKKDRRGDASALQPPVVNCKNLNNQVFFKLAVGERTAQRRENEPSSDFGAGRHTLRKGGSLVLGVHGGSRVGLIGNRDGERRGG